MASLKDVNFLFPTMSVEYAKQIVYHASYGTQCEDLSILSQITTNGAWVSRQKLGNVFQGMGSKTSTTTFKPITNTIGSKFRTATLTDIMPKDNIQIVTTPVFAGKRQTPLLQEFINVMNKGLNASIAATEDASEILKSLITLRIALAQILAQKEVMNYGTVPWFKVDGEGFPHAEDYQPVISNEILAGVNTYFHELEPGIRDVYKKNEEKIKKSKQYFII